MHTEKNNEQRNIIVCYVARWSHLAEDSRCSWLFADRLLQDLFFETSREVAFPVLKPALLYSHEI